MNYDWIKSNTLAKWPFDGDLNDESPNGYNLSEGTHPPSYAIGKFEQCANFDGTQYGTILLSPGDPLRCKTFTVDAWIKTDHTIIQTIVGIPEFFDYSGNWGWLFQTEGGVLVFGAGAGSASMVLRYGNRNIADSMWHHVVLTIDTNVKIYIDGILDKSLTTPSIGYPGTYNMKLSVGVAHYYNYGVWEEKFTGQINRLEILNTVKTPQDVQREHAFQMGWL